MNIFYIYFLMLICSISLIGICKTEINEHELNQVEIQQDVGQILVQPKENRPFDIGESFEVVLTANVGTQVLGAYDVKIKYDPNVLSIIGRPRTGTSPEFTGPVTNINTPGNILITDVNYLLDSPVGLVELAIITFQVTSTQQNSTQIDLTIDSVFSTNFSTIELTPVATTIQLGPPLPTPTITNTPTITPTPSNTATTTNTPTSTNTLTPTPTYTSTPGVFNGLNENILERISVNPPFGFTSGRVRYGPIPEGNGVEGNGLAIDLFPGDGVFILFNDPVAIPNVAHLSAYFRSTSQEVTLALIALNSPIDNQFGYVNPSILDVPINKYRRINLLYDPPFNQLQLGIQAVNPPNSTQSATIWVDNISFSSIILEQSESFRTQVDGSFDNGINDLIANINAVDGFVEPFFESFDDIAIRLSINETQLAANVGTILDLNNYPENVVASIDVLRESSTSDGGTAAFVLTNGFQNMGVFRHVNQINDRNSNIPESIIIGGDFITRNSDVPNYVIIQNGGPNVNSSIIIDNLKISKFNVPVNLPTSTPTSIIPTPTQAPPTPTPIDEELFPPGISSLMLGTWAGTAKTSTETRNARISISVQNDNVIVRDELGTILGSVADINMSVISPLNLTHQEPPITTIIRSFTLSNAKDLGEPNFISGIYSEIDISNPFSPVQRLSLSLELFRQ